eukprot:g18452.t1
MAFCRTVAGSYRFPWCRHLRGSRTVDNTLLYLSAAALATFSDWKSNRRSSCEGAVNSTTSIIKFRVDNDRPGLLSEATEILKKQQLDIRDARISTEDSRAVHFYVVQDKMSNSGLSEDRLAQVRAALQQLAQGDCQAEPWPLYSSSEVAKHKTAEKGIWVSYKERTHFITFQKRIVHVDLCEAHVTQLVCSLLMSICARAYIVLQEGVYDITKFIENHPGGKDKIMLAAGKAIDPFWRIYQQHTGRGNAVELLESMRIGDLSDPPPADDGSSVVTCSCPYNKDPDRHPALIFHNNKPCNVPSLEEQTSEN